MDIQNLWRCILLIFTTVLTFSCQQQFNSKNIEQQTKEFKSIVGSQVNINYGPLKPYNPFQRNQATTSKPSFTIVSYLNASCSSCIAEINEWKHFYDSLSGNSNVKIQLVFYSDDNFEYLKFLCESGKIEKFPFLFYFDNEREFANQNPLFLRDDIENTVLLDKLGKVLLTGNPLHSQNRKQEYIKTVVGR